MADSSSSIPPSSSSRSLTTGSSGNVHISAPTSPEDTNLPVERAPQQIINKADEPQKIEGRVIYSNPQTEEMRIATEQGEIVLKTKVNLPHNTQVEIRIYKRNDKILADIDVIENTIIKKASEEIIKDTLITAKTDISKLPIIQSSQKIEALLIPNEKTKNIDELLNIISKINKSDIEKINFDISADKINSILYGTNPEEILNSLNHKNIQNMLNLIKQTFDIGNNSSNKTIAGNLIKNIYNHDKATISKESLFTTNRTNEDEFINLLGSNIAQTKVSDALTNPTSNIDIVSLIESNEENNLQKLSSKKYRIDVIDITTANLDKKEIRNRLIKLNEEMQGNTNLDYQKLPIKIARIESFSPNGQPVIKVETYDINNIYYPPETEKFTLQQSLNIKDDMILFIKTVPISTLHISENISAKNIQKINIEDFDPFSNKEWGALKKAIYSLSSSSNMVANNLSNIIPNPMHNLGTTALFFLAALRFGSIKGWLGNNIDNLDSETLEILSNNFSKISNLAKESYNGQWKVISMPLYYEGKLEQMQIYIDDNAEDEKDNQEKHKRFIFNLNLSNMGRMQLDGTLYKERKILNMIVRSNEALEEDIRNNIMQKFAYGLEQTNFKGNISFQSKAIIKLAYQMNNL